MTLPAYSPFLKTKHGEAIAMARMDASTKARLWPLFDVLGVPTLGEKKVAPLDHFIKQAKMIKIAWANSGPCYVDLFDVRPDTRLPSDTHPLLFMAEKLAIDQVEFVPVVGLGRDINYLLAMRSIAPHAKAIAVRLETDDMRLTVGLSRRIASLVESVGATGLPLHLILDCRSLNGQDLGRTRAMIEATLAELERVIASRVTLAASSMVADMGGFTRNSVNRIKRHDLGLWMALAQKGNNTLAFGDYGIIHPDFVELDGSKVRPAAKIRYASHNDWVIVKGKKWIDDTAQHHKLATDLFNCPEFRGSDCWGGHYIESAVAGRPKYGNLETWVSIDQNVHISLTRKQVERVLAPLQSASALRGA